MVGLVYWGILGVIKDDTLEYNKLLQSLQLLCNHESLKAVTRGHIHRLPRQREHEPRRVQAHPVRLVAAVPLAVGFPAHGKAASVRRVARYAMADMRQMHANLMATPGDWTALHKRARRSVEERAKSAQRAATENLELCAARLAAVALHGVRRPGDRHARRVVPVRGDGSSTVV